MESTPSHALVQYLYQALGVTITPQRWDDQRRLPMYLTDRYTFFWFDFLTIPCLVMAKRGEETLSPTSIHKQFLQVSEKWNGIVLYLCDTVTAYERKRLIELHIPFVVPGTQLYLPPLGIELREVFRQRRSPIVSFSPATQVVVLHTLYQRAYQPSIAAKLAEQLGYSRMTMTRAIDELEAAGLVDVVTTGRERTLTFQQEGRALWDMARGMMRSPVSKRVWARELDAGFPGVKAGLTALASYTAIAEPAIPVYAVSSDDWKWAGQQSMRADDIPPDQEPGVCEIEVWKYTPRRFAQAHVTDRLSLYLSLQQTADERVQAALRTMVERIIW